MKNLLNQINNPSVELLRFPREFYWSIGFHLFLFLLLFFINWLTGQTWNLVTLDNDKIRELTQSVRVDIVGLPSRTMQELKNLPPLSSAKPRQIIEKKINSETPDTNKVKDQEKKAETESAPEEKVDFKDLMKNLSQKDVIKAEKNKDPQIIQKAKKHNQENADKNINQQSLKEIILEGNKIREGTSHAGSQSDQEMILTELEAYMVSLPDEIRPYWKLPTFLQNQPYRCRIRIFINSAGEIFKKELVESSGSEEFDERALRALDNVQKVTPPKLSFVPHLMRRGVVLGFPL